MSSPQNPVLTSPFEAEDANKVDAAMKLLGQRDLTGAEQILRDVVSRTPSDYVRSHEQDGTFFLKSWSTEEFVHETARRQQQGGAQLVWLRSAYPRAFYFLGFARLAQGDPEGAIRWLEEGMKLDPHPMFQLEMGKAYSNLKQYERALELYEGVVKRGPEVLAVHRAIALRGKGFQLIELGQLDAAEQCVSDSLMLEPGNRIAIGELQYIEHLRAGGQKAGTQTVTKDLPGELRCSLCGGGMDQGKVIPYKGQMVLLCASCAARALGAKPPEQAPPPPKKWWEFWRP